ncbi:MAG: AraC family transcriptional regulator [Calditrichaeota bacterium]|nr:MAG: AraC family transcriptional regulator [Calditrichota bacterium]MBL1204634.1 AraC family transcriptional regulator [Calditrichota bacterium]
MANINWFSFLILFGVLQGIVILLSLSLKKQKVNSSNNSLRLIIFLVTLTLIGRVVYLEKLTILTFKLLIFGDFIIFVYGPLFYFYLQKYLNIIQTSSAKKWLHFIPACLHIILISPLLISNRAEINLTLQSNFLFFDVIEIGAIIQNSVYIFLNWNLLIRYEQESKEYLSFQYIYQFVRSMIIVGAAVILVWSFSFIASKVGLVFLPNYLGYQLTWVILSLIAFVMAYYAMGHPEIFIKEPVQQNGKNVTSENDFEELAKVLENKMEKSKPFLDPQLTLPKLSEISNLPVHQLSRLINEQFKKNFSDYINAYRIEEFKKLSRMENYKNLTLLAIAHESGFNSKTTFNTAFKKLTQLTPKEYLRNLN